MPKGFFTQGMVVLLRRAISVDELREALADFTVVNQVEQGESWQISGPSVVVEYRPDVNGYVSVDVVGHLWPDTMGDPKEDATLFGAWSMGHFGPYAFPHGLRRACEQPHHWPSADAAVKRHNAFLRLRLSYVFGGAPDAPVMPDDYDAQKELRFLTAMVETLLQHDAAICYFNPGGEVLLDAAALAESVQFHADLDLPPFDAWCNVRLFDVEDGWMLMDSVGNWQLDIPDHEVGFPKDDFSPEDVDNFIRNASLYGLNEGNVIEEGDTMDGPGDVRWQAALRETGLSDPPRGTICWLPTGYANVPEVFTAVDEIDSEPDAENKPWWKPW